MQQTKTERIVEVVIRLVHQISKNKKINIKSLYKQGFNEKEVLTAFSWMTDKMNDETSELKKLQSNPNHTYRYMSPDEKELFTKEALEVITRLQALQLISNKHIDLMIEKAILLRFQKINEEMVKQYIAIFLFDVQDNNYTGSRTIINYYDSIN